MCHLQQSLTDFIFIKIVLFLLIYSVNIEYVYNKNQMFSQLQQLQNRDIS